MVERFRATVTFTFFLAAMISVLAPRVGARPPNDDFADRAALGGDSGQTIASNLGATREAGEPKHAGQRGSTSIWWKWTPAASGLATVHTSGSAFDTLLGVYTGDSLPSLSLVAANHDREALTIESLVTFNAAAGTSYQIAVDGFESQAGLITLTYHVDVSGANPPANDLFLTRVPLSEPSGLALAANRNARREEGEPDHAGSRAARSLWWRWVAPAGGTATFHTSESSFDTVLAVYLGTSLPDLRPVAADDDGGVGRAANVVFAVEAGREYQVAVDGVEGASGVILLHWRFDPPCVGPPAPSRPSPPDGAAGVAPPLALEWNVPALKQHKVIYGNDDRRDVYEVTDPALLKAFDATVAMVLVSDLIDNRNGTYTLKSRPFGERYPLCPGEPFADQPLAAWCSGFLVGPDLAATAGHCITSQAHCSLFAFVFGYRMRGPGDPVLTFPASDVYRCKEVLSGRVPNNNDDFIDWTVVLLDRQVTGHAPLSIRRSGKVADSQSVLVIGYPVGLPAKIAGGAFVRANGEPGHFLANLDTYLGSSGSAVLNADTLLVEGLLVGGEEDFEGQECLRSKRCPDAACAGEIVVRATEFDHVIPANPGTTRYEVRFGPCGGLATVGVTEGLSWPLADLSPGTDYCWQVAALDECGSSAGPVWSFRTARERRFRRGDARDDGVLDLTDAITILGHLFLGQAEPGCLDASDADHNSIINLTDAVHLLIYLFLGGPPPAAPFECGSDPGADGLGCRAYAACP